MTTPSTFVPPSERPTVPRMIRAEMEIRYKNSLTLSRARKVNKQRIESAKTAAKTEASEMMLLTPHHFTESELRHAFATLRTSRGTLHINPQGRSMLATAAAAGLHREVESLLQHCDPDSQDDNGMTALMLAVVGGHLECVKALVSSSDLELRNTDGLSAADLAKNRKLEAIHKLLCEQTVH